MYGFQNNINIFVDHIVSEFKYTLTPINTIVIRSNISSTLSEFDNKNDILLIISYEDLDKYKTFDLFSNSRNFNKTYNFKLEFVTDDEMIINRTANYFIEITLFSFEKLVYLETYINYQLKLIEIEQEKLREEKYNELLKEEKQIQDNVK
jgi:hypothetical protein